MSERFDKVTILSHRLDKSGMDRFQQFGEGVLLDGEVWVTGETFFGAWPEDETDIEGLRKWRDDPGNIPTNDMEQDAYSYLVEKLETQGIKPEDLPDDGKAGKIALVTTDGRYLRLPTREEFTLSLQQLQEKGLVKNA